MLDRILETSVPRRLSLSGLGLNIAVVGTLLVIAGMSAVAIPGTSVKYFIGLAGMEIVTLVALRSPVKTQAFVLLLFITFPVTLRLAGNDAVASGTLAILLCLVVNTVTTRARWTRDDRLMIGLLLGIVLTAAIGAISGGGGQYWGPELRHWLALVGAVAGFLLVLGWTRGAGEEGQRVVDGLVTVIVWVLALHVVVSLAMQALPSMQNYLSVFMYSGQQGFADVTEGQYARAATVFAGGEEFGELLVLLFPFCIYKVFRSSLAIYLPLTLLLVIGVVATGTRSAILLVSLETVLFSLVLLSRRITRTRSMVVLGTAVAAIVIFSPLFAMATQASMQRLDVSLAALHGGSGLTAVLNRSEVWPNAIAVVEGHVSLFGYGPMQAFGLGIGAPYNFHSLYLTLVFEFGILGAAVWLIFFVQLVAWLVSACRRIKFRTDPDALLLAACLISLLCFLLNEIKFEFNRQDSYQQVVWLVFAIMYAMAATIRTAHSSPQDGGRTQGLGA